MEQIIAKPPDFSDMIEEFIPLAGVLKSSGFLDITLIAPESYMPMLQFDQPCAYRHVSRFYMRNQQDDAAILTFFAPLLKNAPSFPGELRLLKEYLAMPDRGVVFRWCFEFGYVADLSKFPDNREYAARILRLWGQVPELDVPKGPPSHLISKDGSFKLDEPVPMVKGGIPPGKGGFLLRA